MIRSAFAALVAVLAASCSGGAELRPEPSPATTFDDPQRPGCGTFTMPHRLDFRCGETQLDDGFQANRHVIGDLIQLVETEPAIVALRAVGHADEGEAGRDALTLSDERAESVRDALLAGGVLDGAVFSRGVGAWGRTTADLDPCPPPEQDAGWPTRYVGFEILCCDDPRCEGERFRPR